MADQKDKSSLRGLILPGMLAIMGTLFGGVLTGYLNARLAREKYQSDLILRAMAPDKEQDRLATLRFMIDANIVTDDKIRDGVRSIIARSNLDSTLIVPQIVAEGAAQPETKLYSLSDLSKMPDTGAVLISEAQLKEIVPSLSGPTLSSLTKQINRFFPKYQINTPLRAAAFLSQVAFESGNFTITEEYLKYSASALVSVFPARFNAEIAKAYAGNAEKIANRIYANKLGNGDEASGDGWKYHGRGYISLTGKDYYAELSKTSGVDLLNNPDLLKAEYPLTSACQWWAKHGLNELADKGDIVAITRKVIGGLSGFPARKQIYDRALAVLKSR